MSRIIILILIIFTNISVCVGTELKQIDLKTAIELAQKNNLDIKSNEIDVNIAKNEIDIANKLQNPSLESFFNFGKAGRGNANQAGISQTLELFKRAPRKNLAKANYNLVLEEFEKQKFNLQMDTTQAYIKLVVAKSILQKYEEQQKYLEILLKISNQNNKTHEKLDLDTIEARIALNQMITEVNKAKTNAKIALIEFNKILNSQDNNYDSISYNLIENRKIPEINIPSLTEKLPSFKDIEDLAIKNRFDIKIAKNQLEMAKKKLDVVMRQKVPDIELIGGYAYQTIGLAEDRRYKSGAYLGANIVNIPVFYTYKPEIKNAQLEIEKANIDYISTINKAKKDVEIAYEKFTTAQLNFKSYNDKILKDSEDLFRMFEEIYKVEKINFPALAAVEESYQDLVNGYSEALSDYYTSWIDFLREINSYDFMFNNTSL
ncbi:TolC family protein [bacterium]|nr:TolC family protein [bacterium]